jgi:hypothetical protein
MVHGGSGGKTAAAAAAAAEFYKSLQKKKKKLTFLLSRKIVGCCGVAAKRRRPEQFGGIQLELACNGFFWSECFLLITKLHFYIFLLGCLQSGKRLKQVEA